MTILFKYTNRTMAGWQFVKVDATKGILLAVGDSQSTSEDLRADLSIFVASKDDLEMIKERF